MKVGAQPTPFTVLSFRDLKGVPVIQSTDGQTIYYSTTFFTIAESLLTTQPHFLNHDLQFVSVSNENGVYSYWAEFAPRGANSFRFKLIPIENGGKSE